VTAPTVDVHAHLMPSAAFGRVPDGLLAHVDGERGEIALEVAGRGGARGRGAPLNLRDLDEHRRIQASRGVEVSLLGPWIDMVKAPNDASTQHAFCTIVNEELARATHGLVHSRFLAALSDLDGGAAADDLARAVELGAVGGMLAANPGVGTLARADLDPLWDAAQSLGVPLVLHPGEFQPPERLGDYFMVNLVGNPFETTLAVGSLLGADVPARFPGLKLVLVHGGGFFPYQYGRLTAGFARWPALRRLERRPPADYLRWFWYDTVLFDDAPTRYLLELVGPARVMAGSDCPFAMSDHRPFEAPERLGLSEPEIEGVLGGTATRLFGLGSGAERAGYDPAPP
jgi:aminocarboxymuconate-semialdehyde decarboxylase